MITLPQYSVTHLCPNSFHITNRTQKESQQNFSLTHCKNILPNQGNLFQNRLYINPNFFQANRDNVSRPGHNLCPSLLQNSTNHTILTEIEKFHILSCWPNRDGTRMLCTILKQITHTFNQNECSRSSLHSGLPSCSKTNKFGNHFGPKMDEKNHLQILQPFPLQWLLQT